jgi:hypothetical protein
MTPRPTLSQVAAGNALLYAVLVVAMNLRSLGGGVADSSVSHARCPHLGSRAFLIA